MQTFQVGDYVLVKRPPRLNKRNNELAIKLLPKWDGPYRITAKVKDYDNYRLEHAYTSKHLDPTNVDKLIRVQPWALDNQDRAHAINNPDVDQDDQTQEPDEPKYSVGDFVVFEQAGTDNLRDDDLRTMIRILFDWLYSLTGKQASTSEACKMPIIRKSSKALEEFVNYFTMPLLSNLLSNRPQVEIISYVLLVMVMYPCLI